MRPDGPPPNSRINKNLTPIGRIIICVFLPIETIYKFSPSDAYIDMKFIVKFD